MEVKETRVRKPTTAELVQLIGDTDGPVDIDGLVYASFSESGAMGRPGDVVLGFLEDGDLVAFHFNYHKWEKDDERFSRTIDQIWGFIQWKSAAVNPVIMTILGTRFKEDPTFMAAFDMGNHFLLNRSCTFELDESDLFYLGDDSKTSLYLPNIPVSIFGPRLFPDSRDQNGR